MVITVSDANGIKQYNAPDNIKKIFLLFLAFIVIVISTLGYYVKSLNDKLTKLEKNIKTERIVEHVSPSNKMNLVPTGSAEKLLLHNVAKVTNTSGIEEAKRNEAIALKKAAALKAQKEHLAKLKKEKEQKEQAKRVEIKKQKLVEEQAKINAQLQLEKEKKLEESRVLALQEQKRVQAQKEHLKKLKREEEKRKKEALVKVKKEKLQKAKKKREALAKKEQAQKEKIKKEKRKKEKIAKAKKAKEALAKKKKLAKLKKEKSKSHESHGKSSKAMLLPKIAKSKLGRRYVWGAVGPRTFDCSGFTSYVYKKTGIVIPRTSRQQSKYGKLVDRKHLKPGDLIFFDTSHAFRGRINHVGMYIGNNQFIHASSAKKRVVITSLNKKFYSQRFRWARRVVN